MNTHKLSVLVILLVCILISGCTPAATPTSVLILPSPTSSPTTTATSAPVMVTYPAVTPDPTKNIGQVIATIPLAGADSSLVTGAGGVWVSHGEDGIVERIDPATNMVVAQIKVGIPSGDFYIPVPGGLVSINNQIWTTNGITHDAIRIDPVTNEVAESIPFGDVTYPKGLIEFQPGWGVTTDGVGLWAADFNHSQIVRLDLQTKQITSQIIQVDHAIDMVVDGDSLWVALHRKDSVARIDPKTNAIVATIPLPLDGKGPESVCSWCIGSMAVGDGSVWVSLGIGNAIARIDPATNQVIAKINLEGSAGLAFSNGWLWVAVSPENCDNGNGYLMRIDPKTNTIEGKIPLDCPGNITIGENSLWVDTLSGSDQYSVVRIQPNP